MVTEAVYYDMFQPYVQVGAVTNNFPSWDQGILNVPDPPPYILVGFLHAVLAWGHVGPCFYVTLNQIKCAILLLPFSEYAAMVESLGQVCVLGLFSTYSTNQLNRCHLQWVTT